MRKYIFEAPKRRTKTKTDTAQNIDQDNLKKAFQRPDDFPAKYEPEKKTEPPKAEPKLRTASSSKTKNATNNIQLPQDALDKLSRMKVDVSNEPEIPTPTYELVKPEVLPNVINRDMVAAGYLEPEWHMIKNLPGYMLQAIRALGRPLFKTQTRTQLEKILCVANVMNQGPNTDREINAIVKWAKENGEDLGHGDIDFEQSIPGYDAEIHQFATKHTRFMLVKDSYGAYIYAWPEQDSLTPSNTPSLGAEHKRLAESLHYKILLNKRAFMRVTNITDLLEDFNNSLRISIMESEQKIQFIAQQMGEKIKAAIRNDNSPASHQLAMALEKQPDIVVRELAKADPTGERHDYLQFIVRMYVSNQFRVEDLGRVRDELTKFIRFRSRIQNKDLNSYKSLNDLYDIIEKAEAEFGAAEQQKSKSQQEKETKIEGAETIINEPNIKVVHLKTAEAAKLYAAGTRWCTSSASTFQHYARQGAIYVIIAKDPKGTMRKFQMHYESEQVMNERDQSINPTEIKMLSELPAVTPGEPNGWTKFLNYMIELKYSKYFEKQAEQPAPAAKKKKAARPAA